MAVADLELDAIWPGGRHPLRHFDPTARLLYAPRYLRQALSEARRPGAEARRTALAALGHALHCRQDAIAHGVFGWTHALSRFHLLGRDPDVWETMPARVRARVEADTRAVVRRFLAEAGPSPLA